MNRLMVFSLAVVLLLAAGTTAEARVSHGYSDIFSLDTVTAVDDQNGPPQANAISTIYPNPFNPRTTIEFELAEAGQIELAIFDLRGRLVRVRGIGITAKRPPSIDLGRPGRRGPRGPDGHVLLSAEHAARISDQENDVGSLSLHRDRYHTGGRNMKTS